MTRSAVLAEHAQLDIDEARVWYASHAGSGIAREFVDAVDAVIARITEFPENHPIVHARLRLARLRRFPYLILFAVETNAIVVYRCVHTRRDPRRWREPIR